MEALRSRKIEGFDLIRNYGHVITEFEASRGIARAGAPALQADVVIAAVAAMRIAPRGQTPPVAHQAQPVEVEEVRIDEEVIAKTKCCCLPFFRKRS